MQRTVADRPRRRNGGRRLRAALLCAAALAAGLMEMGERASAQGSDPAALAAVRAAVTTELNAAKLDRSPWEYRDHDIQPEKDVVAEVLETPKGDLKRVLSLNGHALTGKAAEDEVDRMRTFVNDPDEQARKKRAAAQDDAQAREMLAMLPKAFIWNVASEKREEITLRFRPDPAFHPPDMQSRVLGVMAGELVVARDGNRIQTLRGTLTQDVKIGFGLLGKIDQGGTFDVERREIAPGHWQITETHVHIGGRALLFKTIGQEEDETKTQWRPSTAADLAAALEQLAH